MHGAVSNASDADGVASFPDLRFGVWGQDDGLTRHHQLAFCTPGKTAPGVYDGCAISCPFRVASRAVSIKWSIQPTYLRSMQTAASAVPLPGEPFSEAPADAVVRFVDASGTGVPSKRPLPWVIDVDAIVQVCQETANVTLSADDLLLDFYAATEDLTLSCVLDTFLSMRPLARLGLAPREGMGSGLSGHDGFLVASVAFETIDSAWMYAAPTQSPAISR